MTTNQRMRSSVRSLSVTEQILLIVAVVSLVFAAERAVVAADSLPTDHNRRLVAPQIAPQIAPLLVPKTSIGKNVIINCNTETGSRPITFTWMKDDREVQSSLVTSHGEQGFSILKLDDVRVKDRGNYSCSARNAFGEDHKTAQLLVDGEFSFL